MAPVGRWQKGKDLSWYAKADTPTLNNETVEEKRVRERKEEIRRIKEAEEDALAKALGLPVPNRGAPGAQGTGSNNVEVGELKRIMKETEAGNDESEDIGRGRGFGDFVGKTEEPERVEPQGEEKGGLLGREGGSGRRDRTKNDKARRDRRRSRSREGRHRVGRDRHDRVEKRPRHRSRSGDIRHKVRRRHEDRSDTGRSRSRSPDRNAEWRRYRERRSPDRERPRRDDRDSRRDLDQRPRRRSRSPDVRDRDQGRDYDRRESGPERRRTS